MSSESVFVKSSFGESDDKYISITMAAKLLRTSRVTMHKIIVDCSLPSFIPPGTNRIWVKKTAVDELVRQAHQGGRS